VSNAPTITLNNGSVMPQLGFGVWQVPDDEAASAVRTALEAGYRSIDTAAIYDNERGTGQGVASSGLPRDEVFVTTKLWNAEQGHDSTLRAFDASLDRLGLEYVDLYLIHWPMPGVDRYVDTWKAFEKIHSEGRARAIGVSNFQPAHLQRLFDETGTVPALNQIELHPRLQQSGPRAFHAEHGIATEAWSPIAQGKVLDDPVIERIADAVGRSPAQVVLRWHFQRDDVVFPKSVSPARMKSNFELFDFELGGPAMEAISDLDQGESGRTGPNPDKFDYVPHG
jgi:2,5-diketo-D-gluconate reductase A